MGCPIDAAEAVSSRSSVEFPVQRPGVLRATAFTALITMSGCSDTGLLGFFSPLPPLEPGVIELERAFPGLTFEQPVALVQGPDGRWYLVEQAGRVWTFEDRQDAGRQLFVDLSGRVESGGEAGLLGIAFHPQYVDNREVFLSYTIRGVIDFPFTSIIARFRSLDGGRTIAAATEEVVLNLEQPFSNHNGGQITFGPDSLLYVGLGDGGSAGDPLGHGQNPHTLLGTLLRIDVDGAFPYAIPLDNPFFLGGGRPEVYAFGLRNPWRWSFDRETGQLWLGDVGQNAWEEINVIVPGGNYGWSIREGAECFGPGPCPTEGLIDPVAAYPTRDPDCAVIGGYVYRGSAIPAVRGAYLFGDFCSGRIRGFASESENPNAEVLVETGLRISSFAQAQNGELFVLDHGEGGIYRIVAGR
jgi:glucose/arabinose dehydrogenase